MPSKHAKLSASAAYRWMNCPGSIKASEGAPPEKPSEHAEEGTTAHALAELKLRNELGEIKGRQYERELNDIRKSEYYCGEMEEATDFYLETVWAEYAAAGPDAQLMIEQLLDLREYVPEGFGTSDAVIIADNNLTVIDLKYGKGIKVDAEGNPQLRLYALGALELFSDLYDLDTITTIIIQPRLDHISIEKLDINDLLDWGEEVIKPAAELAMSGKGSFASGDWCKWCPAKALCRKRAEDNLELAKYEFAEPALLSDDEIADVLLKADELTKWVGEVKDYALTAALAGAHFDGFKLVEGRSNRKYKDELEVAKKLTEEGFDEAMLYERKLLGITNMEKLVGKKRFAEVLKDLIIKPQGKPVLVPDDDPRDEINSAAKAADDFKEDI